MSNYSRRSPKNLSRRERRASGVRTYNVPSAPTFSTGPRRSYMAEPAPFDYATEYRYVRKDLGRILLWAALILGAMLMLSFLPIVEWLSQIGLV